MRTAGLLGAADVPGRASSVGVAREYVRSLLHAAGRGDADEVALLVSELIGNSVRHSDSGRGDQGIVRLVVADTVRGLRVEVIDEGSPNGIPQIPAQVDPLSESGRGLWLVREMSSAWGWTENESGLVVWFEMAR
ncbi:ATP-binding protein [Sphaerisporangium sp. TRM90804]|uniref:ATP-binding protein n=1 Tax=Sphaerisporangium sp. TRM90804 TaxID=3031113 RepID=UPI002446E5D3|nr:ATP-binding protein [Sphaerisporangium sp. TRM90804]MDH2427919.1 ATP-binding protein [Sphaerisporangium sp. TRM90804]